MSGRDGAPERAMTTITTNQAAPDEGRWSVAEGWSTLAALVVLVGAAAAAVDDSLWAGYIRGTDTSQTWFLVPAAVLATVLGFVLARSSLPRLWALIGGASACAVFLVVAVAGTISAEPDLFARLRALNASLATFVHDVLELGIRSAETSVFLLLIGAVILAAGLFAALAIFRDRRPVPAIAVAAIVLMLNMLITTRDQLLYLVVLAAAALFIVIRLNLLRQMSAWRSRNIADTGRVAGLFVRSGAVFVALAVIGSIALAANASSAPLARTWRDFDQRLLEFGYEVNHWLGGVSGPARGPSNLFSPVQTIRDVWESSTDPVLLALTSDGNGYYLRGATFDSFDGRSWQQLDVTSRPVAGNTELLSGTLEQIPAGGRRQVFVEINSLTTGGDRVLSPEDPLQVDRATELLITSDGAYVGARVADGVDEGEAYLVTAMVREASGPGRVTAAQLAAAGVNYPAWARRYVEVREGSVGPVLERTTERVVNGLPSALRDPYHITLAVQRYLFRDGGFQYQTDVRGMCTGELLVDCFLAQKRGYCEYFATAMVMMLRSQQIPARYVLGYLPGKQQEDGGWLVDRSAAHSWVEVYFPGYGWIRFDPTPGNRENGQTPTNLVPGNPDPEATPRPQETPNFGPDPTPRSDDGGIVPPPSNPGSLPPPAQPSTDLSGPLVVLGLLLAVLATAWLARQRFRPPSEPALAYATVARLATRLGHGPRPSQTAYEFAVQLGDVVPAVRSDMRIVAMAKVESAYGHKKLAGKQMLAVRQAVSRIRRGLLRLVVQLPQRWLGRRSPS
ncbi:MAG TPA: transglutaminaseTgpA domain-containing protein [Candidatus Limnocylindrales bacterium]